MSEEPRAGVELSEAEWALIESAMARLRASVLSLTFGLLSGTGLALATLWLVVQGGDTVGPHLGLLSNYFPGYTVTWGGAVLGFFYGAVTGAVVGGAVAWIYNSVAARRTSPGAL